MAPQLWERQLDAGAGGITAATPAQLRAMRAVGVPRLLLANEVVDADAIGWIAHESGGAAFACWVDAVDGVALLADALAVGLGTGADACPGRGRACRRANGRALVRGGGRRRGGGCTPAASSRSWAWPDTKGTIGHERTAARARRRRCVPRACSPRLLAVGSTRARGRRAVDSVPAAACSSTGRGARRTRMAASCSGPAARSRTTTACTSVGRRSPDGPGPRFRPAIEAWGSVLSRPEPEVAVIGLGKRDVPSDIEPPIPLRMRDDDRSLAGMVRRAADGSARDLPCAGELRSRPARSSPSGSRTPAPRSTAVACCSSWTTTIASSARSRPVLTSGRTARDRPRSRRAGRARARPAPSSVPDRAGRSAGRRSR